MRLLNILSNDLLLDSLIFFPLVVGIGLALAGQGARRAVSGAFAVLLGWVVLALGLGAVAHALMGFDPLWSDLFRHSISGGRRAAIPLSALHGHWVHAFAITVLLAYAINVVWARLSPARYLFINPLQVLLGSTLMLLLMHRVGASPYVAVPIVAVLMGSAMAWLPWLAQHPYTLMESEPRAVLGSWHTTLLIGASWLAARLGSGTRSKGRGNAEPADLSGGMVASPLLFGGMLVSLTAAVLYLNAGDRGAGNALAQTGLADLWPGTGTLHPFVGTLLLGGLFAGGLWIVVQAAPVVLRGVVDSFAGWQRLLPGVQPAVDPIFMVAARPRPAVVGFLLSLVGGTVGYYLFGWMGLTATIPGMLVAEVAGHLLGGGACGVVAERAGGRRGLLLVPLLHGLVLSLVVSLALTATIHLGRGGALGLELSDLAIVGALLGAILHLFA